MEDGPDLGDFIAGVVPREGEGGYSGKLKLEKGERNQLTELFVCHHPSLQETKD